MKSKKLQTIKHKSKTNGIYKRTNNDKNYFEKLPTEIIDQIFLQIINHRCEQGHKWCFKVNNKHRYNRNRISFLTNICHSWTRYVYPYIWKRRIELNRNLSVKEQKRTMKLMVLLNNKNSIAKNYINELNINYNFITNNILSNIINNTNININISGYILNKESFNKEILIDFYKNSDDLCICCNREPVYWSKTKYLGFCLSCLYYKYKITIPRAHMEIIEELNFLENNIFVDDLRSFLNEEIPFSD